MQKIYCPRLMKMISRRKLPQRISLLFAMSIILSEGIVSIIFDVIFVKEKLKKLQETMQLANSYGALEVNKPTP